MLLACSAQAADRITHFHSAIRIGADGSLEVTERIAVIAEGAEVRDGLLRDFPAGYAARHDRSKLTFTVTVAKRDGKPRGEQVYEIRYRAERQAGFFDPNEAFTWNVNGNGWTLPIERISAEVVLPAPVPRGSLKAEAATGLAGAQGRNYESFTRDGGVAFRSTRPFQPREGMSIVVAFPAGVVAPPTWTQRARWFFAYLAMSVTSLFGG